MAKRIKIAGASGYWGESDMAVPQLIKEGGLDYIVFDYLAEITMSIMARQRAKRPNAGYARDFVSAVLAPNLKEIARQGVKIISNAGGINPQSCAKAIRTLVKEQGLDLKVGVIYGDDILEKVDELTENKEMFSDNNFPDKDKIVSINSYIGAFPIAEALTAGADIIVTGRCVDSAVTLGACIHEFGWSASDYDLLSAGSLAGHIIECGPQATGGNYTDWKSVKDTIADIGYPIVDIAADGTFLISKPKGTGGTVTVGTVGEQMLYEIGDPQAYYLPDVVCDFADVIITQKDCDVVKFTNAKGYAPPAHYKTCVTHSDGWRLSALFFMIGEDAPEKAKVFSEAALIRARRKLREANQADYTHVNIETLGDDSHFGSFGISTDTRELAFKMSVRHETPEACNLFMKEATGLGLATPPGMAFYTGGRPKASPVVRLFSTLVPKALVNISIDVNGMISSFSETSQPAFDMDAITRPAIPKPETDINLVPVPLKRLAFGRSGDKGDKSNIGILPRRKEYAPYIWAALTESVIRERFDHFVEGEIERFYMPGTGAMNVLMHKALGGGGMASLRNDSQGKSFAQIMLQAIVPVPAQFLKDI